MSSFVGLILAAGEGKRFGQPKAGFVFEGERLVDRAVRIMREAGAEQVYVVLGAWNEPVANAITIDNPDWKLGMGSSLRVGLKFLLDNATAQRVVVSLVDLPGLTASAIARIGNDSHTITAAIYDDVRGHPVAFNREVWAEVAASASGDSGARTYLAEHNHLVKLIDVADVASIEDMDYPL